MPTTSIWNETATGTDSGATATHAAATGRMHIVRHISGHTDADALIQILDGASVVYQTKIIVATNGNGFSINFPDGIQATPGAAIAGVIDASTADAQVNISGYSIP